MPDGQAHAVRFSWRNATKRLSGERQQQQASVRECRYAKQVSSASVVAVLRGVCCSSCAARSACM